MNFVEDLKRTAVVGTAQKELNFPPPDGKLGETLSKFDRADKEKFLLSAAAALSVWKNAGNALPTDPQPAPENAENETQEILAGRLKQILETLLESNKASKFFPEFLGLMEKRGKIIPPELLPAILSTDYLPPTFAGFDFRHLLLPVIGNRGKWLAKKRRSWRWALVEETGEELWETGNSSQRIFALEFFRLKNAGKAREILQAVWQSESAKERQKFLEVLRINLSEADEEFLDEIFRTDRSAEVKRTAFELLANLPATRLSEETAEICRPVLTLKKKLLVKKEIEINLPNDWSEKTADLKTVAKQIFSDTRYFGEKAMALVLGLSVIKLQVWEESLGIKASEIVALAHQSDWSRALLAGFGMASIRFENQEWFAEILKYNAKFALTRSPLFAWRLIPFNCIPARRLVNLLVSHEYYVYNDWLLANLKLEPEAISEDVFRNSKKLLKEFTRGEGQAGWKNPVIAVPFGLIDEWAAQLEKSKIESGFSDNQKNLFEEIISDLNFRREYILEFEK